MSAGSEHPFQGPGERPSSADVPGDANTLSRRNALKILSTVPVVAALGGPSTAVSAIVTPASVQGPVAPKFFTAHEWKTVRILVDYIIPRDEHSGSATDAKVPEYMDYLLSEKDANVNTQIAIRGGLGWLDTECHKRFSKSFIEASDPQRRSVLDDIAYPGKATPEMRYGIAFFNRFRDMTASGFFSSAMGWQDLKYIGNVANPGYDGCPPAALEKLGVSYDLMQTRVSPETK
jgi:gluconate 2-dehydrogenase gamma chain